ncbi:uncharacterized protein [Clytia hemisphaerica]|uniref:uncharacterized protein isoform X2 n=1 Tax=Clytia hemisphaerica TaxID=252671 RepID=UPI0034D6046E
MSYWKKDTQFPLKKYLDIHRREEAFDLSSSNKPLVESDLSKYQVAQGSRLDEDDIKHLTKTSFIDNEIKKLNTNKHLTTREASVKANLEMNMSQYSTGSSSGALSPYSVPLLGPQNNRRSSQALTGEEVIKRRKKRRVTSARVGRANRAVRTAPPKRITSAERERIVNMTTKLLVATETIALPQDNRPHSGSSKDSEESCRILPEVRKMHHNSSRRPKSAYSDPGKGPSSKEYFYSSRTRANLAENTRSENSASSETPSTKDGDFSVKRLNGSYIITKNQHHYPSSILSGNSLNRPKSGRPRLNSNRTTHVNFSSEEEEDLYDRTPPLGFTPPPLEAPKRAWKEEAISSDQVTAGDSSPHSSDLLPSVRSPNDLQHFPLEYYKKKEERDMSTQTRPPPKVTTYAVYVVTGNKMNCGTTASVRINLFGEYGDSGDRPLFKSRTNKEPFKRNQVDVFNLDCMSLGKLSNIRIAHNGLTPEQGWYLDRVVVNVDSEAYEFQCQKWLSVREGDGQIVRDVLFSSKIPISQLPSQTGRKLSASSRISSSDENPRRSSLVRRNSSKTMNNKNNVSRNNSIKRKNKTSKSGDSYSSSSDSEAERENRNIEKQKRREKRQTKELPNQDKPKANVGGIINKVNQTPRNRRLSRDGQNIQSPKKSQQNSPRNKTPSPKNSRNTSPSPTKTPNYKPGRQLPNAPRTPSPKKEMRTDTKIKLNGSKDSEKADTQAKEAIPSNMLAPPTQLARELSRVSSLSESSSLSSSSSDEETGPGNEGKKTLQSEDQLEFSNKDTIKKYSEPATAEGSNDLYMAGFLAGIKAHKPKGEGEEDEDEKKKREFEEKLKNGPTIHQACENGDIERLKELVGMVPELKTKGDERGWAPIHICSAFGHLDLVKWLSVNGVNLKEETPTGYTAIHLAAMNGHVNCMMILSAMGCPISSRTVDDFTPLHLASMSGHIECVKWLLSNRAKLDVKDVNGRTPLDLAEEYQHVECIKLLKVMKRELSRKDSVMAMLRDSNALKQQIVENGDILFGGRDSGVDGADEEEWVSDTEGTSDVVGRGGDDRTEAARRASVQGRKTSLAMKGGVSSLPPTPQRRLSKQEMRQVSELEDKKRVYQQQVRKQVTRRTSFLDSIRAEIDGGEEGQPDDEF